MKKGKGLYYYATGVYFIIHVESEKVYVGSSARSIRLRCLRHQKELNGNIHGNLHLQRAWNKYGEDAFVFTVAEFCSPKKCIPREQYWIDRKQAANEKYGYNVCSIAGIGNMLGVQRGEAFRIKCSLAQKKRWADPEVRKILSEAAKKRMQNPEYLAKSIANLNSPLSLEKRKKSSRLRMSDPKNRKAISEIVSKQWSDPSMRIKMIEGMKRYWTLETRKRQSRTMKASWANPNRRKLSKNIGASSKKRTK
jgi:group I intron endonuclease